MKLTINNLDIELVNRVIKLRTNMCYTLFTEEVSHIRKQLRELLDQCDDDVYRMRQLSNTMDMLFILYHSLHEHRSWDYVRFIKYVLLEVIFSWIYIHRLSRHALFESTSIEEHYYKFVADRIDATTINAYWKDLHQYIRRMEMSEEEIKQWYHDTFNFRQDKYCELFYHYISFHVAVYEKYQCIVPRYIASKLFQLKYVIEQYYRDVHPDRHVVKTVNYDINTPTERITLVVDNIKLRYVFDRKAIDEVCKKPVFLGDYTIAEKPTLTIKRKPVTIRIKKKRTYVLPKEE